MRSLFFKFVGCVVIALALALAGAQDNSSAPLPGQGSSVDLQTVADPNAEVARTKDAFREQEQQAAEMARRYRQVQTAASPNDADLQKFKAALENAVRAAFEARQKAQRHELEQLRERLAKIEARLASRDRQAEEIVRQRVEQLLHPERDWEVSDDVPANAPPVSDEPKSSRSNRAAKKPPGSGMGGMGKGGAVKKPGRRSVDDVVAGDLGEVQRVPSAVDPDRPGTSSNPRKDVLDAEFAVSAARANVEAQQKKSKSAQDFVESLRRHAQEVPEIRMRETEKNAEIASELLKKARLDLEHAEAQVHLARENLVSHRKLLVLDLENAKLRLNHRAGDESRARQLIASNAISRAEYEEKKLALDQAKLEIGRIQEQLDLYSKPIPGVAHPSLDDQKPEEPAKENEKSESGGTRERLR